MIFQPPLVQQIRAGKKTQTRRPAKDGEPCRYREGKSYAVQPGRGQSATCRIYVTAVRRETVGEIAFTDARAEGFPTTDDFKTYWVSVHDRAWLEHEKAMLDDAELDDGVVLDRDLWLMPAGASTCSSAATLIGRLGHHLHAARRGGGPVPRRVLTARRRRQGAAHVAAEGQATPRTARA
jgi:uncharacterized protein YhfF